MLVRDDLPQQRRKDLETLQADDGRIETLAIELSLKGKKWLFLSMYKQPLVKSKSLVEALEWLFNQSSKNLIVFGDLNVNMMKQSKCLKNLFEVYGMKNLVTEPTCFKGIVPTLLDLVVTNAPSRLQNVTCIESDLSDCHKMICWATRIKVPAKIDKVLT